MTDSAPPEDASPAEPVAKPAASRWAKLWGMLKRFRGPIVAIAAFGAVLSGLLGYWRTYETVQTVVVSEVGPGSGYCGRRPTLYCGAAVPESDW